MSILIIIFVVVFSIWFVKKYFGATVVHIQPWWQCIYLVQYYAAMYFYNSAMHKVHQVNGHVVYVYWIDTAYVQNNLPTEFSKMTIFII